MQLAHRRRAVGGRHSIVKRWLIYSLSGPFLSVAIHTLDGQARLRSTHGRRLGSNHARRNSKKLVKTTNVCAIDIFSYCSAMNCQMPSAPHEIFAICTENHRHSNTHVYLAALPIPAKPTTDTPARRASCRCKALYGGGHSTTSAFCLLFDDNTSTPPKLCTQQNRYPQDRPIQQPERRIRISPTNYEQQCEA